MVRTLGWTPSSPTPESLHGARSAPTDHLDLPWEQGTRKKLAPFFPPDFQKQGRKESSEHLKRHGCTTGLEDSGLTGKYHTGNKWDVICSRYQWHFEAVSVAGETQSLGTLLKVHLRNMERIEIKNARKWVLENQQIRALNSGWAEKFFEYSGFV